MRLRPLPDRADRLLRALQAPPRLVAHLTLVHDVACSLVADVDEAWPPLCYDRDAVRLGAALHDIGKAVHPDELTNPGHDHEHAGEILLLEHGQPGGIARFARTHRAWTDVRPAQCEDMLVALADALWRGKRDERLEATFCAWLVERMDEPPWQAFLVLDGIAARIAAGADERLTWQNAHPVVPGK